MTILQDWWKDDEEVIQLSIHLLDRFNKKFNQVSNWKMKGAAVIALLVVCCCYVVETFSASIDVDSAIGEMGSRQKKEETPADERTFSILALSSILPLMRKFFKKIFGPAGYWRSSRDTSGRHRHRWLIYRFVNYLLLQSLIDSVDYFDNRFSVYWVMTNLFVGKTQVE